MSGCYIPIPVVCDGCNKAPHIRENGNWWIGEEDTGVKAQGSDGTTPHIGENGNWFLGEMDTGVKAEGAGGDDYSTTATRIGTWIDGRPLYRRVFQYSGTIPAYDHSQPEGEEAVDAIPNSELGSFHEIIRMYGFVSGNGGAIVLLPSFRLSAQYDPSFGIKVMSRLWVAYSDLKLVVEYT